MISLIRLYFLLVVFHALVFLQAPCIQFHQHLKISYENHKVRHPRCVYNKLDWSLYTCLTQLYGGIDMYNLLHKDQLHVSALFIAHLQVDK